ncbi:MAG: SdrD B-like domain-containing protein, partial [Acidobacteriota bacterium]
DGTSDGTGAIYRLSDPGDGLTTGISLFLNLNSLFGSNVTGANPHPTGSDFNIDAASYAAVAKVGLGDLEMSEDERTLWAVNLSDRRLYQIPLGDNPRAPVAPTSSSDVSRFDLFDLFDCDGDGAVDTAGDIDLRPFGLAVRDGLVYVGLTCSAQSTNDPADLRALVYSFDPDTGLFAQVLNFGAMTYARGCGLLDGAACVLGVADWLPWHDDLFAGTTTFFSIGFGGFIEVMSPQPILSDIEFAADGTMLIGLRDRFGDQFGFDRPAPNGAANTRGDGYGDLLRATLTGPSTWTVSAVEATDGTEFFADDDWTDSRFGHDETSWGGLALRAGSAQIIATRMDPLDSTTIGDNDFSGGLRWTSTATGATTQSYEIYDEALLGKANGLGDLELLCEVPPVEIGDRVWCDADSDGVQDPGEADVSGATLELVCDTDRDGTIGSAADLTATTTSNGSGQYLFSNTNVQGGVPPFTNCEVRIDRFEATVCAADPVATAVNAGGSGTGADLRDSDGVPATTTGVVASFTTGRSGANNHTLDFGFAPAAVGSLTIDKTVSPDGLVAPGTSLTYSIEIENPGPGAVTDVTLDDLLPAGVTYTAESTTATQTFLTPRDVFRVTEYFTGPGTLTATTFNLTLDQPLEGNYFVMVQGSDGVGGTGGDRGPDENYFRLTADPFGTGDLAVSSSASTLQFQRDNNVNSWVGVVTVVECLSDCATNGFQLLDVQELPHTGTATSGSVAISGSWTLSQAMIVGGYAGAGCLTPEPTDNQQSVCHARIFPSGANTIEWTRNAAGSLGGLTTATSTAMAIEWGSAWTVQRVRVQGTNGGNGANAAGEYTTAALGSAVARADTWVWGTGHTGTVGVGESAEGVLITLGNGVAQNANESTVAVGTEFGGVAYDFEVYALTHPDMAVDYRFKTDGSSGSLTFDQTVDLAGAERMAIVTNGTGDGGDNYPRSQFSARYFNDTTVRLQRRRSGANFPAWVQGIDFSSVEVTSQTLDNDSGSATAALADGSPPALVTAADNFDLASGETLVVTFDVTVDDPATASFLENVATANGTGADPVSDDAFNYVAQAVGALGDFVWYDRDSDGVFDADEVGLEGVQVNLHAGTSCLSPVIATTTTNSDGFYSFENLGAGSYCVEVYEATLPARDLLATTTNPLTTTLTAGQVRSDIDFGFTGTSCLPNLDFERDARRERIVPGQILDTEYVAWGVTMSASGGSDQAMAFDSANPSGGDPDLGAPNEAFGGPGDGAGGAPGAPFENPFILDNVIIISEDGDQSDPDDNSTGGTFTLTFDRDVEVDSLTFLDNGDTLGVDGGEIRYFDMGGTEIGSVVIPGVGDNGYTELLDLGGAGIRSVEIELFGSGSLDTFGFCPPPVRDVRLGDRVWLDADGDGLQDIGEPGIDNVEVTLYDAGPDGVPGGGDDVAVATQLTDAFGLYLFDDLPPGSFYVDVTDSTVPSGLDLSPGSSDESATVTLAAGETNLDVDFGYTAATGTAVVGDTVWLDADSDGLLDPGERGLDGVTVDLIQAGPDGIFGSGDDVVVATTTTNAAGRYLFTGVAPGVYAVDVTDTGSVLTGYTLSVGPQSMSDPSPAFQVREGDVYLQADFGYVPPPGTGDRRITEAVWYDADGDGLYDSDESGIQGVTVELRDSTGAVVATTLTDAEGRFEFPGVDQDDFTVVVTDSAGVLSSLDPTTPGAVNTFSTASTTAGDFFGESFGYRRAGTIGDTVWRDSNADGVKDADEVGIAGIAVDLWFDANGNGVFDPASDSLALSTTTDASGNYLFTDLVAGTYFVDIDDTQGAIASSTLTTPDDDADAGDQRTIVLSFDGDSDLTADFGYDDASLPDLSGNVFEDFDRDGIDDGAGEPGFAGVTLELLDGAGNVLATTTTDANGDYVFEDLVNGPYTVRVTDAAGVLEDYQLTSGLDAIDVNILGVDVTDVDFGYVREATTGAIGDFVWLDADRDGVQDGAEGGIGAVTLELYLDDGDGIRNAGDTLITTTQTGPDGRYLFENLPPGVYFVDPDESTLPAGLAATTGTGGDSGAITLVQGQVFLGADFGYASSSDSAIGDFVWYDADGDGEQDPGEVGIEGVTIELRTDPSSVLPDQTIVTGPDGSYLFTGLANDEYFVTVDPSTLPAGVTPTPTNIGGTTWEIELDGTFDALFADWGFTGGTLGSIGDTVFLDRDGDGTQDPGEPGIAGVTLDLIDSNGVRIASTVTAADGTYDFQGLQAGDYTVDVTDTAGVLVGLNLSAGSDPTSTISLAAGQDFDLADFGYAPSGGSGTIGNRVWHDLDSDGVFDADEPGFERVTVDLWLDSNGNGVIEPGIDNFLRQVETDVNGEYAFTGLAPADYLVQVTDDFGVLTGFSRTFGTAGVDENGQPDPYASTLTVGAPNDFGADFSYFAPDDLSIAGTTFFDRDGDGGIDVEDFGVDIVTVLLFRDLNGDGILDSNDALIDTEISDGVGDYLFPNLPPGDYIVAVDATGSFVDGASQTTQLATLSVEPVTLVATDSMDNDFGFTRAATSALVTDFDAWIDSDGSVVITWRTASESGTAGFDLYRFDGTDWVAVNESFVASLPSTLVGATYSVRDLDADSRSDLRYALVEQERFGGERQYGPFDVDAERLAATARKSGATRSLAGDVSVVSTVPSARQLARLRSAATLENLATKNGLAGALGRDLDGGTLGGSGSVGGDAETGSGAAGNGVTQRIKVRVADNGLQRIEAADLAVLFDRREAEMIDRLKNDELRLLRRGSEVAWTSAGTAMLFYGEARDSLFGTTSTYVVELGVGTRMETVEVGGAQTAETAFDESLHLEEDLFAATFVARDASTDYWHWKGVIAEHASLGTVTFSLQVPDAVSDEGTLSVHLRGASEAPVNDEHLVDVSIDGESVGLTTFDDLDDHVARFTLPRGALDDGVLEVAVSGLLQDGVTQSFFYVDSFDVDYRRAHRAVDGSLIASIDGPAVRATGFTEAPTVLDITDPLAPRELTGFGALGRVGDVSVAFERPRNADRFVAADGAGTHRPALEIDLASDWASPQQGGDYVIVAGRGLADAAQDLADYRASTGYTPVVVRIDDVMDELRGGDFDPTAIRDLLQLAARQWSIRPTHLVLVGDGHFDYRDLLGFGGNLLPPAMLGTPYGLY